MMPLFSATNTRPLGANSIAIGCVSPLKAVDSEARRQGRSRVAGAADSALATSTSKAATNDRATRRRQLEA